MRDYCWHFSCAHFYLMPALCKKHNPSFISMRLRCHSNRADTKGSGKKPTVPAKSLIWINFCCSATSLGNALCWPIKLCKATFLKDKMISTLITFQGCKILSLFKPLCSSLTSEKLSDLWIYSPNWHFIVSLCLKQTYQCSHLNARLQPVWSSDRLCFASCPIGLGCSFPRSLKSLWWVQCNHNQC